MQRLSTSHKKGNTKAHKVVVVFFFCSLVLNFRKCILCRIGWLHYSCARVCGGV